MILWGALSGVVNLSYFRHELPPSLWVSFLSFFFFLSFLQYNCFYKALYILLYITKTIELYIYQVSTKTIVYISSFYSSLFTFFFSFFFSSGNNQGGRLLWLSLRLLQCVYILCVCVCALPLALPKKKSGYNKGRSRFPRRPVVFVI